MPVRHIVAAGESIPTVAAKYGFFDATVWDHTANRELKRLRTNPNVLHAGDVVEIPDRTAISRDAATGGRHVFRRKGIPCIFRLQLFAADTPRANQDYVLEIDGARKEGKTDERGMLIEFVLPSVREGKLTIGPDLQQFIIEFGTLDPETELSGLQQRLANLGFRCPASGTADEATRAACRAFQQRAGLAVTGTMDPATVEKLVALHDLKSEFPPLNGG
jgi:hypothetical protein